MHEAVAEDLVEQRRDDSDTDDNTAQLIEPITKQAPSAYDPSLHLSSSVGHLQLECVPEDVTELEDEVQCAADDVDDDDDEAVDRSDAAAAAAAATSDDGLEQRDADQCLSSSVCNNADMSAPVESKSCQYFIAPLAITQLNSVYSLGPICRTPSYANFQLKRSKMKVTRRQKLVVS